MLHNPRRLDFLALKLTREKRVMVNSSQRLRPIAHAYIGVV